MNDETTLLQQLDAQTDETRRAGEEIVRLREAAQRAKALIDTRPLEAWCILDDALNPALSGQQDTTEVPK